MKKGLPQRYGLIDHGRTIGRCADAGLGAPIMRAFVSANCIWKNLVLGEAGPRETSAAPPLFETCLGVMATMQGACQTCKTPEFSNIRRWPAR